MTTAIDLLACSGLGFADAHPRGPASIALTAAASDRARQAGERAGCYRYLTKPIHVEELLASLEAIID